MSSEIARKRAEIEDAIAGRTLCDELRQVAETAGAAGAYADEAGTGAGDGWHSLTWEQARQRVLETTSKPPTASHSGIFPAPTRSPTVNITRSAGSGTGMPASIGSSSTSAAGPLRVPRPVVPAI